MDISKATSINMPNDIIGKIFSYINPDRLHNIAKGTERARYIVNNNMCRSAYIEKWLDTHINANTDSYVYKYILTNHYITLTYEIENYWYYILCLRVPTYLLLMKMHNITILNNHAIDFSCINNIIKDVSQFSKVHSLDLSNCIHVTDVSKLGGVHTLNIKGCHNAENINKLYNIHTLNISCNITISDIGIFGNVYKLTMRYLRNNMHVGSLTDIYKLDLEGCNEVKGLRCLGNVHTLNVSKTNIYNELVCYLSNISNLDISYTNVSNINMLGCINTLTADYCDNLENINMDMLSAIKHISYDQSFDDEEEYDMQEAYEVCKWYSSR